MGIRLNKEVTGTFYLRESNLPSHPPPIFFYSLPTFRLAVFLALVMIFMLYHRLKSQGTRLPLKLWVKISYSCFTQFSQVCCTVMRRNRESFHLEIKKNSYNQSSMFSKFQSVFRSLGYVIKLQNVTEHFWDEYIFF